MKKNKKFTFVYADFTYNVTKDGITVYSGGWYSEGIAQLAAVIEKQGWEVNLIHLTKPIKKSYFLKSLKEFKSDIIGFSFPTGSWRKAREMIQWAAELDTFIITGSYHTTLWPDKVIKWKGVDAVCIGEGENPVKELLNKLDKNININKIGSIWIKDKKGNIHKNPVQSLVTNLNELPLPKFDIFDFTKLLSSQIKTATVVLTRGCPFNCTYCWNNYARSLYPNKQFYVRHRNPQNCLKYIKKILKVYPELLTFRFQDDLWPFYNDWFDIFSNLYIENVHIPFECHLRADLLNEKIISRLKDMKCFGVYFGVESGNEYIRNKILKRNMSDKSMLNAFHTCKKYDIKTHAYNIVGIPHENMLKVLDTIKLNARLEPTDMFYFIFFPYAGTELSDIAIENNFFDPNKVLDPYVNIEMPDFKKEQIRFASLYGRIFTRLYQFVLKAKKYIRLPFEKILDFLWLWPRWPFSLLNSIMVMFRKFEEILKSFIKRYFFGLYLYLKR